MFSCDLEIPSRNISKIDLLTLDKSMNRCFTVIRPTIYIYNAKKRGRFNPMEKINFRSPLFERNRHGSASAALFFLE